VKKIAFAFALAASLMAAPPSQEVVEAIKKGDVSAINTLITSKEEANAALPNGKSILMLAVWEGKADAIKELIKKGADINAMDDEGKNAIMLAVWRENIELTKALIALGADTNAKNREGLGIAEVAELTGNGEVIDYVTSLFKPKN